MSSEETAESLGRRGCAALMAAVLRRGFGVMLAERLPSGHLFETGRRLLAGNRFDELFDDVLGITIYRDSGRVGFVGVPPARLVTASPASVLLREWSDGVANAVSVSEPVITSFDLWSSSRSENSSRARLLLLVMAIEALVSQERRPEDEVGLINKFISEVHGSSLTPDAKTRLRNGLSLLKRESVGSSCQRFVTAQLGETAGDAFRASYRVRNVIAHGGTAPNANRLVQGANQLEPIVKALLLHALTSGAA